MRKRIFIVAILFASVTCFSQSIVNRANSSYTVQDSRFKAALNLFVPVYADTTAANAGTAEGIDSLGAIIYTYDVQSFWGRQYSSGKKWVALGSGGGGGSGTVTSVGWTGGIVSIANPTTTPAFTIAGTSGGIPYFSSSSTWATSAALAANSLIIGGGAGVAPSSITTGTGILTALGVNIGSAGAPVLFNGAGGTPSSITLTNGTGLPIGGLTGLGTGVGTALAVNVGSAGAFVTFNGAGGTPSSMTATNLTGTATALSIGGNAATATILQTARNIQGVSFNGSAAIDIINGTGFVKVTGTTLSYDNSTYVTSNIYTADGTLSGDRIITANGNSLEVKEGISQLLNFSPASFFSVIAATNHVDESYLAMKSDSTLNEIYFELVATDNVNPVSVIGDVASQTLIYNSGTHQFNGNTGVGGSPTALFQVINGGANWLSIDPTNGGNSIQAFNPTDNDNTATISTDASSTIAEVSLVSNFNDGVKVAHIDIFADVTQSYLEFNADTHTFTGSILPVSDNSTDIGSASAAFQDIYGRIVNLDGSTSGGITIQSDALGNAINGTTLSGTGYVPSVMFGALSSDFTMSDVNTVQPVFPTGFDVWTLQASTTYFFEGTYILTHNATSHSLGMSFELAGGASVTSISYTTLVWATAIGTTTASQNTTNINVTTNVATNSAGSNAIETVKFSGILRVNAGGTFTPSITFSAAPGGTCLARVGTYIRFTAIGTSSATNLGNAN